MSARRATSEEAIHYGPADDPAILRRLIRVAWAAQRKIALRYLDTGAERAETVGVGDYDYESFRFFAASGRAHTADNWDVIEADLLPSFDVSEMAS